VPAIVFAVADPVATPPGLVLKTPLEERVIELGWDRLEDAYDPSPRPQADLTRMKGILERERGVPWREVYSKGAE